MSRKIRLAACLSPAGYSTVLLDIVRFDPPDPHRTAPPPLMASPTTALPFPVQVHMLVRRDRGTTRCCPPPRVPRPKAGPARGVLSSPHASPLSPPLWSATHPFQGRGGLHESTRLEPEGSNWARGSGLTRFGRLTAVILPMRSGVHQAQRRAAGLHLARGLMPGIRCSWMSEMVGTTRIELVTP